MKLNSIIAGFVVTIMFPLMIVAGLLRLPSDMFGLIARKEFWHMTLQDLFNGVERFLDWVFVGGDE